MSQRDYGTVAEGWDAHFKVVSCGSDQGARTWEVSLDGGVNWADLDTNESDVRAYYMSPDLWTWHDDLYITASPAWDGASVRLKVEDTLFDTWVYSQPMVITVTPPD
jgi:hypothetical protein